MHLSEQHPREQGLKPIVSLTYLPVLILSEQHPREQGLKHVVAPIIASPIGSFRATSKRTRIETGLQGTSSPGLWLSEQHPREQGLKLTTTDGIRVDTNFQSNIQENKD